VEKMKIEKEKHYKVKFAHCFDETDTIEDIVIGKKFFRLRNMLLDLGYEVDSLKLIE
jgi:hypothetical protein